MYDDVTQQSLALGGRLQCVREFVLATHRPPSHFHVIQVFFSLYACSKISFEKVTKSSEIFYHQILSNQLFSPCPILKVQTLKQTYQQFQQRAVKASLNWRKHIGIF